MPADTSAGPRGERTTASPGELAALLARAADVAVVIRRGPRDLAQLIRWDLARDVFEPGQWFHGRVYTDRCDLSPHGRHLVYFAARHHLHGGDRVDPTYTSTWTAVSRPPYFTALALWPNSGTTYAGGGLFEREDVLLLNQFSMRWPDPDGTRRDHPHPEHGPPAQLRVRPLQVPFGEAIAALRAQRDGWTLVDAALDPYGNPASGRLTRRARTQAVTIERSFGSRTPGYRLIPDGGGGENGLAGATWADFDRRGRLLFARDGQLFELPAGPAAPRLLADFRGHVFTPVPPPEWAQRW